MNDKVTESPVLAPTPRTDLAASTTTFTFAYMDAQGWPAVHKGDIEYVSASFARQLERELAEAKAGWLADLRRIASALASDVYNVEHLVRVASTHLAGLRGVTKKAEAAETALAGAIERCAKVDGALRELVETEMLLRAEDERGDVPDDPDALIAPALAELLIRHGNAWKVAMAVVQSERPAEGSETSEKREVRDAKD